MLRLAKVVYASTTWTSTIPQRPWTPSSKAAAGSGREVATSGVPESWTTRRDELLTVRFRFTEAEWEPLRAFLVWAQDTSGAFNFFPDASVASAYTCYLESPVNGEEVLPERGDFPGTLEIGLVFRRTTAGAPFTVAFY